MELHLSCINPLIWNLRCRSSNELQWKIGLQDSNSSNAHQADIPYWGRSKGFGHMNYLSSLLCSVACSVWVVSHPRVWRRLHITGFLILVHIYLEKDRKRSHKMAIYYENNAGKIFHYQLSFLEYSGITIRWWLYPVINGRKQNCDHWNENVAILMKFSSLDLLKVVRMTTFSAASDENFHQNDNISVSVIMFVFIKHTYWVK